MNARMYQIIPAVIPHTLADLAAFANQFLWLPRIQIDVVDGKFVSDTSWPYNEVAAVAEATSVLDRHNVMVDLMVADPLQAAVDFLLIGASELVIHLESVVSLDDFVQLKSRFDFSLWIAGNDTLPISEYVKHADYIDGIQLMGIHTIGAQAQPFSDRVLENCRAIIAALPQLPVVIDGSVNKDTIRALYEAGARQFVVGSALQGSDPRALYTDLVAELPKL